MSGYLLDTDVLINHLRGIEDSVRLVRNLFESGAILGCCPINISESYAGMKPKRKAENRKINRQLILLSYHQRNRQIS